MTVTRWLTALLGAAAVLAGTLAGAQSLGGAAERPVSRGRPAAPSTYGTVISADIAGGVIEAEVSGRRLTLYPIRATTLLSRQEMKTGELSVGDRVSIDGFPTKLTARRVTADKALQPEPVDVQPTRPVEATAWQYAGQAAYGAVSGMVASVEPLVVSVTAVGDDARPVELRVEVSVPEDAVVSKLVPGQWTDVQVGVPFAFTLRDDDWQRMVLDTMVLNAEPASQ